jgi:hypothetical protein
MIGEKGQCVTFVTVTVAFCTQNLKSAQKPLQPLQIGQKTGQVLVYTEKNICNGFLSLQLQYVSIYSNINMLLCNGYNIYSRARAGNKLLIYLYNNASFCVTVL